MADSTDPNELLNQLKQIAIVCQRLGIDLGKVSAMGQNIGGKGTTGNSPLQTQNPDHVQGHPGGGTGYTNLASGLINASSMSAQMAAKIGAHIQPIIKPNSEFFSEASNLISMSHEMHSKTKTSPAKMPSAPPSSNVVQGRVGSWYTQLGQWGRTAAWNLSGVPGKFMPSTTKGALAQRIDRKMSRTFSAWFFGTQGVKEAYQFLATPLDERGGETWGYRAAESGASLVKIVPNVIALNALMEAASIGGRGMGLAWKATKAANLGRAARTLFTAAKMAGPQIAIAVAAEAATSAISEYMARWKQENSFRVNMAAVRQGFMGDMHRGPEYIHGYRYPKIPTPLSAEAINAMQADLEKERMEWYIDSYGRKQKRGIIQRTLFQIDEKMGYAGYVLAPALQLWNWLGGSEDKEKLSEFKIKRATAAHEDAMKKAEIMDWDGAKFRLKEAKELFPEKAADSMPFFWREPEKFLKNMEAARISARNWARSQQPRGGLRTGD